PVPEGWEGEQSSYGIARPPSSVSKEPLPIEMISTRQEAIVETGRSVEPDDITGRIDSIANETHLPSPPCASAPVPLNGSNFLPRGASVAYTKGVWGLVLYTGDDTRLFQNKQGSTVKMAGLQGFINKSIIFVVCIQLFLVITMSVFSTLHGNTIAESHWYLGKTSDDMSNISLAFISILRNFVLTAWVIPLSLFVTLELARFINKLFIEADRHVNIEGMGAAGHMNVRSSNLIETLGCIDYVLTDKTGTLTQNSMVFKGLGLPDGGSLHTSGDINDLMLRGWKKHIIECDPALYAPTIAPRNPNAYQMLISDSGDGSEHCDARISTVREEGESARMIPDAPIMSHDTHDYKVAEPIDIAASGDSKPKEKEEEGDGSMKQNGEVAEGGEDNDDSNSFIRVDTPPVSSRHKSSLSIDERQLRIIQGKASGEDEDEMEREHENPFGRPSTSAAMIRHERRRSSVSTNPPSRLSTRWSMSFKRASLTSHCAGASLAPVAVACMRIMALCNTVNPALESNGTAEEDNTQEAVGAGIRIVDKSLTDGDKKKVDEDAFLASLPKISLHSEISYVGDSPDELALVHGAAGNGFQLVFRG
ncbi:hypothetical protein ADUPG1_007307, partial [Aduncisulcus paluster]